MTPKANSPLRSLAIVAAAAMFVGALAMFLMGLCIGASAIAEKERRIDVLDRMEQEGHDKDAIRKERIAIRNEIGGVVLEFPVKAVEGSKWGSIVGVVFGGFFGQICFGLNVIGSSSAEKSNSHQCFASVGCILGAIPGAIFGVIGGTIGMFLPLLEGMGVYGAFLGLTAACLI